MTGGRSYGLEVVVALALGDGTVRAALVDRNGRRFAEADRTISGNGGPGRTLIMVGELADTMLRSVPTGAFVRAAGVVVPAGSGLTPLNPAGSWRETPLAKELAGRVDLPLAFGQAVPSAALGESRLGAGRAEPSMFYVSLGAEVGAAHAINGVVDDGASGLAGQLGHLVVRADGPVCSCGNTGCLAVFTDPGRIGARYSRHLGRPVSARHVATLAKVGDPLAGAIWDEAVSAVADALTVVVTLLDPAVVVVGGELATVGEVLWHPLRELVDARLSFRSAPPIRIGALGPAAAMEVL